MLRSDTQMQQEAIDAAILAFGLQEIGRVYPVVQERELEKRERLDFAHVFAVLVAGRTALVYRDWDGAYKVKDDPDRPLTEREAEEKEAYLIFLTAAQYLELAPIRIGSLEVQDITSHTHLTAPIGHAWLLTLNGVQCRVNRYDEERGPRYGIHTQPE